MDNLIDRILLGPAASSTLAQFAIQRLLPSHERTRMLAPRVSASTTPYRILGRSTLPPRRRATAARASS